MGEAYYWVYRGGSRVMRPYSDLTEPEKRMVAEGRLTRFEQVEGDSRTFTPKKE